MILEPENNIAKKRNLLRGVRRQRLKYIAILPSLITILNGICGFAAIGFAAGVGRISFYNLTLSSFAWGGYMIFIAMIADMLDGRVARMSHTTSSFGGQLDSMCDIISFGVAPAFLVLNILDRKVSELVNPESMYSGFLIRFIWIAAAIYVICAAIRLARFNVENEEDETAHMSFIGLPTPSAAGTLASLVIFHEHLLVTIPDSLTFAIVEAVIVYSLPFVTIGTAILMVSRVRYPHLVNIYLKGRKPITHLIWSLVVIALIGWAQQIALVVCFCGFTLTGFVKWCYFRISAAKKARIPEVQTPTLNSSEVETGTDSDTDTDSDSEPS